MPPKSHGNKRAGRGVGSRGNSGESKQVQGHQVGKDTFTALSPTPVKMIYVPPPPPPEPIISRISPQEFISLLRSIDVPSSTSSPSSSTSAYHTKGIENPRNLCFRNVIVQSLLAVTPFRDFLYSLAMLCPFESIPDGEFKAWKEILCLIEEVKIKKEGSKPLFLLMKEKQFSIDHPDESHTT